MKLATWNVNSLTVRLPQVLDWLSAQNEYGGMDVLALQETKTTDDKFPQAEIEAAGYHVAFFGQKTYNGVALIAKHPITEVVHNIPGFSDEMAVSSLPQLTVCGWWVPISPTAKPLTATSLSTKWRGSPPCKPSSKTN